MIYTSACEEYRLMDSVINRSNLEGLKFKHYRFGSIAYRPENINRLKLHRDGHLKGLFSGMSTR